MRSSLIMPLAILLSLIVLLVFFNNKYLESRSKSAVITVLVTIKEGSTVNDINKQFSLYGILNGAILSRDLEGYLFPDTYEFFVPSDLDVMENKFRTNFDAKVLPLVPKDKDIHQILTVASIIEKEVPDQNDRLIVSGIIWKRFENNFPLQVDATICYIKEPAPCYPLTKKDFNIDSPYNTYQNKGLPPAPISNPGIASIKAALNPKKSPYWFYLTDTETYKTIFAVDFDEHNRNIDKYLNK